MAAAALGIGGLVAIKSGYLAAGIALSAAAITVGAYVDQTYTYPLIFGNDRKEQPKLIDVPIQTASEGSPAVRCIGEYNRIAPQMMYATDPPYKIGVAAGSRAGLGKRNNQYSQTVYGDMVLGFAWNKIRRVDRLYVDGKVVFRTLPQVSSSIPVDTTTGASGTVTVSFGGPTIQQNRVVGWTMTIRENVAGSTALGRILPGDNIKVGVDNSAISQPSGTSKIRRYTNPAPPPSVLYGRIQPESTIADGEWPVITARSSAAGGWEIILQISGSQLAPCFASIKPGAPPLTFAEIGDPFSGGTTAIPVTTGTVLDLSSSDRPLEWNQDVFDANGPGSSDYELSDGDIDQDVNVLEHTLRTGSPPVAGNPEVERYPGISRMAIKGMELTNFGNRYPSFNGQIVESEDAGPAAAIRLFMNEAGISREVQDLDDLYTDIATGSVWGNALNSICIYIPSTAGEVPQDNDVVYIGNRTIDRRYFVREVQESNGRYSLTLDRPLGIDGINAPSLAVATELLRDQQTLYGLTWAGLAEPIRQVQVLRTAFFLDSSEYNGRIRVFPDDQRDSYALSAARLDNRESADRPGRVLDVKPVDPTQVPDRVDLTYLDIDNNNLSGSEHDTVDRLRDAPSDELRTLQFELPGLAMDTATAKATARKLLQAARERRFRVGGRLPRTDHLLQEGDEVTTTVDGIGWRLKIDEVNIGANGAVEFEGTAVTLDPRTEEPPGVSSRDGLNPSITGDASASRSPVAFAVVDAQPSRPEFTNEPGFFVAACPLISGDAFPGAGVYESRDDGDTWELLGTVESAAVIGSTTDASGLTQSFSSYDVLDSSSTLTIELIHGSLETVSSAEFDDNRQLAMIGDEVVAFRDATQNADGSWTIDYFRRGLFGTPTTHTIDNETFVLLDSAALAFFPLRHQDINVERTLAVVNAKLDPTEGSSFPVTIQAWNARPVPPTDITADRSTGTQIDISWSRASRVGTIAHDWDATFLPELENELTYDVVFDNGREYIGQTGTSVTYTADQMFENGFDIENDTLQITVYQVDAAIGRCQGFTITSSP